MPGAELERASEKVADSPGLRDVEDSALVPDDLSLGSWSTSTKASRDEALSEALVAASIRASGCEGVLIMCALPETSDRVPTPSSSTCTSSPSSQVVNDGIGTSRASSAATSGSTATAASSTMGWSGLSASGNADVRLSLETSSTGFETVSSEV